MILRRNVALGYDKHRDRHRPAWADTQLNFIDEDEVQFCRLNPLTDTLITATLMRAARNLAKVGQQDFAHELRQHAKTPSDRLRRLRFITERAQNRLQRYLHKGCRPALIYAYADLHVVTFELDGRLSRGAVK